MKKRLRITTIAAIPVWAIVTAVILWGGISVRDVDMFNRMPPEQTE
jgi:hypothetical protein